MTDHRRLLLVWQHLGEGQAHGIVDRDTNHVETNTDSGALQPIAGDAVAQLT